MFKMNLQSGIAVLLVSLLAGPAQSIVWGATSSAPQSFAVPLTQNQKLVALTEAKIVVFQIALADGIADKTDAQDTIDQSGVLFESMEVSGQNEAIQKNMIANEESFINSGISSAQQAVQLNYAASRGAKITLNQYRNSLTATPGERAQQIATIKKVGMKGWEAQFIQQLKVTQEKLPARTGYHPITTAAYAFSHAHIVRAGEVSICAIEAGIWALGAFWFPPLAIIAAVYAIMNGMGWC